MASGGTTRHHSKHGNGLALGQFPVSSSLHCCKRGPQIVPRQQIQMTSVWQHEQFVSVHALEVLTWFHYSAYEGVCWPRYWGKWDLQRWAAASDQGRLRRHRQRRSSRMKAPWILPSVSDKNQSVGKLVYAAFCKKWALKHAGHGEVTFPRWLTTTSTRCLSRVCTLAPHHLVSVQAVKQFFYYANKELVLEWSYNSVLRIQVC